MRTFASCLLVLLVLACSAPRNTLTAPEVILVNSITEVLKCKYVGTVFAIAHPPGKFLSQGEDYPLNSKIAADVLVDAQNRAHELGGNRILTHDNLYKGSQQFDAFFCPEPSLLKAYAQSIDSQSNQLGNLSRLCKSPGAAQRGDFEKCCEFNSDGDNVFVRILENSEDRLSPARRQLPPVCK